MKQQLTLGQLIKALKKQPPANQVRYGFGWLAPHSIDSYRGYYNHLALNYDGERQPLLVEQLITILEAAVGETFIGYKGGDFQMDEDTPVWVGNHGEAGDTAVVGVKDRIWFTQIQTKFLP